MKTTVFMKPGQVAVKEVDMPKIMEKDDVILRVVRTCVCGSDLQNYRGDDAKEEGSMNSGNEVIGIVEEAGEDITTFKKRRVCHCAIHSWLWALCGLRSWI